MFKEKILYSFGIVNEDDLTGEESFFDIEENRFTILNENNFNYIIVGNLSFSGLYKKPKPDFEEIRKLYQIYNQKYEGDTVKVFERLMYVYDAKPFFSSIYQNRYIFKKNFNLKKIAYEEEIEILENMQKFRMKRKK